MDRRVNRAYELACQDGLARFLWWDENNNIPISKVRPERRACVKVDPRGFAIMLAASMEDPTN